MTFSKQARLGVLLGATALTFPAFAADRPADASGARAVADFVAAYAGKASAPSVQVATEGAAYLVTLDLGALNPALKSAGFVYDPAQVKFRVFQQDDGQWRVELAAMPPVSGRMTPPAAAGGPQGPVEVLIETKNPASSSLIDPKLGWIASSRGGADKLTMAQRGQGFEQFLKLEQLRFEATTRSEGQGLTTLVAEPVDSFSFTMDVDAKAAAPKPAAPKPGDAPSGESKPPDATPAPPRMAEPAKPAGKPVHISAKGEGGMVELALKNFKPAPLTDAWRFFANHPERADYARDFEALKTTVNAVLADTFALDEAIRVDKLHVTTEKGLVELEGVAVGIGLVNGGADSGVSERFATKSIKLPDGMVPAIYAPLVPTSYDIGFKASGFDLPGAAQEWFANAHLEGDGPPISKEGQDKVMARLVRGKPVVIDILPSKIVGPSVNLAFQGKVTIDNSQPTGSVTIQVPNFDQTAQAVQQLGPDAAQKLAPAIAMIKGLSKAGPDGALIWVCDLGTDKVMKVNGLPLGKSPF